MDDVHPWQIVAPQLGEIEVPSTRREVWTSSFKYGNIAYQILSGHELFSVITFR